MTVSSKSSYKLAVIWQMHKNSPINEATPKNCLWEQVHGDIATAAFEASHRNHILPQ